MSRTIMQILKLAFVVCIAAIFTGCASPSTPQAIPPQPSQPDTATVEASSQIANPASENCINKGGKLVIQKRGDGGEYGVCFFEDNRQCEEWALMRGDCREGGAKVTGYVTDAAIYCVITGGEYTVTDMSSGKEQGKCAFKNGKNCDAADYFNGKCDPNNGAESYGDPFAYCMVAGTADEPGALYTGEKMPDVIVQAMIAKGIVATDAPKEIQQNAVWRCMDKKVWVCHFGANIPCQSMADTSQTPNPAMEDYCKANPSAENIPADTTGRATVYEWKCVDGKPAVVKQVLNSDPQGFIAEFWYELSPK